MNLAAAVAELGRSVLLVDLDPQGNASTGLGVDREARRPGTYEALMGGVPVKDALVSTSVSGVWALPATIDLAGAEVELVGQLSREGRLARTLLEVQDRFELTLLDCPPSIGLLTINALTAADELIVPIQCEYFALEGLGQLLENVRLVQQSVNPRLTLAGILLTMFDGRTKLSEDVAEQVRGHFGAQVYESVIPRSVRVAEAPGFGQPITQYDPRSSATSAYRALATEIMGAKGAVP